AGDRGGRGEGGPGPDDGVRRGRRRGRRPCRGGDRTTAGAPGPHPSGAGGDPLAAGRRVRGSSPGGAQRHFRWGHVEGRPDPVGGGTRRRAGAHARGYGRHGDRPGARRRAAESRRGGQGQTHLNGRWRAGCSPAWRTGNSRNMSHYRLMKLNGLLSRSTEALPGVSGVARVDRNTQRLLRRIGPGEIAILDALDLDRVTAEALVRAEVAGVVNASPSISGRFPNLGPEILVGAGIPLIDGVGVELLRKVKDGSKVRLLDGVVYAGEKELGRGTAQTPDSVADQM